jgi:hypothetical protein
MRKDELKRKEALKWNNRQSSQGNLGKPNFENLQFGWPELQIFMMKQCLEMSLISEDFQKNYFIFWTIIKKITFIFNSVTSKGNCGFIMLCFTKTSNRIITSTKNRIIKKTGKSESLF